MAHLRDLSLIAPVETDEKRINRRANIVIAVGLAGLLAFLVYDHVAAFSRQAARLSPGDQDCVRINAAITARHRYTGYRNSGAEITYTYRPGNPAGDRSMEKKEAVDELTYDRLAGRDSVAICYDAGNPEKSNIILADEGFVLSLRTIIMDVLLLIGLVAAFIFFRNMKRKEKEAAENGGNSPETVENNH